MIPSRPTPLAIRFENLFVFIKQRITLAVINGPGRPTYSKEEGSDRVKKLHKLSAKLQLWASMLIVRRPTKESLVGDVLEAIDVSESVLGETLHKIFSEIATHVSKDDQRGWDQDLDDLDDLIPEIRRKYADLQQENISGPPRPSLVLCFDGGGVASFSSLLILRALMLRVNRILEESAAKDDVLSLLGTSRPRDFFDYVFGSSSGGMIAIMLGRLQMTVDECIESFKAYADDVFTHARKHGVEKDRNPKDAIAVFVSIGSGKRPLPDLRASKAMPGLKTLEGIYQNTNWAAWTYTERAHEEVKRATWETSTAYYRLNAGEGMGNMRIDEWKKKTFGGKNVNRTLELIERETIDYLENPETEGYIQSCAEKLVQLRRKQL